MVDRLWGCSKLKGIPQVPDLDLSNALSPRQTPTGEDSWRHFGAQTLSSVPTSSNLCNRISARIILTEGEREKKKKRTQGLRTLGRRGCVSPGRLYMHIWFYHFMLLRFLTREIHSGQPCLLSSEGRKQRWEVCLSRRRLKHSDKIQNRTISKVTPRHIKSLERYRGPESFLHCLLAIGTAVTPEPPRYRQVTITKTLIEFNFMSVTVCFPASPGASLL